MPTGERVDWLVEPGDLVAAPHVVGAFRFAGIADGVDAAGQPVFAAGRARVTDAKVLARTLTYLRGGAAVYQSDRYGPDYLDRARPAVVPVGYRTDGEWVWPDAVGYYLERYGLGPEPELAAQITRHGYRCPPVTGRTAAAALTALRERARIMHSHTAGG